MLDDVYGNKLIGEITIKDDYQKPLVIGITSEGIVINGVHIDIHTLPKLSIKLENLLELGNDGFIEFPCSKNPGSLLIITKLDKDNFAIQTKSHAVYEIKRDFDGKEVPSKPLEFPDNYVEKVYHYVMPLKNIFSNEIGIIYCELVNLTKVK